MSDKSGKIKAGARVVRDGTDVYELHQAYRRFCQALEIEPYENLLEADANRAVVGKQALSGVEDRIARAIFAVAVDLITQLDLVEDVQGLSHYDRLKMIGRACPDDKAVTVIRGHGHDIGHENLPDPVLQDLANSIIGATLDLVKVGRIVEDQWMQNGTHKVANGRAFARWVVKRAFRDHVPLSAEEARVLILGEEFLGMPVRQPDFASHIPSGSAYPLDGAFGIVVRYMSLTSGTREAQARAGKLVRDLFYVILAHGNDVFGRFSTADESFVGRKRIVRLLTEVTIYNPRMSDARA